MKDNIRAGAMAIALVAVGLFWWQVAKLEDCRDAMQKGGRLILKSECPPTGPYAANSNVFVFAVLSLLFPTATAEQRSGKSN